MIKLRFKYGTPHEHISEILTHFEELGRHVVRVVFDDITNSTIYYVS